MKTRRGHRLKIGGALYGAKLADAEHGPSDWIFRRTDGHQRPDIRMPIARSVGTRSRWRVGTFAALGEALLQQAWGSRVNDPLAGGDSPQKSSVKGGSQFAAWAKHGVPG